MHITFVQQKQWQSFIAETFFLNLLQKATLGRPTTAVTFNTSEIKSFQYFPTIISHVQSTASDHCIHDLFKSNY